jgi:hypothetical protein
MSDDRIADRGPTSTRSRRTRRGASSTRKNPIPNNSNVAPIAPIHRSPHPKPVEANAPDAVASETGFVEPGAVDSPVGDEGEAPEEPDDAVEAARPGVVLVAPGPPVGAVGDPGAEVEEGLPGVTVVEGPLSVVVGLVGVVVGAGAPVDVVVGGGLAEQMAP